MNTDKLLLCETLVPYITRLIEICSILTSCDYAQFYARLIHKPRRGGREGKGGEGPKGGGGEGKGGD